MSTPTQDERPKYCFLFFTSSSYIVLYLIVGNETPVFPSPSIGVPSYLGIGYPKKPQGTEVFEAVLSFTSTVMYFDLTSYVPSKEPIRYAM